MTKFFFSGLTAEEHSDGETSIIELKFDFTAKQILYPISQDLQFTV